MVENGNNNNHSKKRQDTADRIIKALSECKGLLTLAAKKAGISYPTINRYVKDFPSVAQAVHEAKESLLDFAEGKLYTAMSEGNMTALIFYLKTQGKGRGYIERQEFTGQDGGPIKVDHNVLIKKLETLAGVQE